MRLDSREGRHHWRQRWIVAFSLARGYTFSWSRIGRRRMRFPVAAKIALHKAGGIGGTPGSGVTRTTRVASSAATASIPPGGLTDPWCGSPRRTLDVTARTAYAKALGQTIPRSLLLRADQLIGAPEKMVERSRRTTFVWRRDGPHGRKATEPAQLFSVRLPCALPRSAPEPMHPQDTAMPPTALSAMSRIRPYPPPSKRERCSWMTSLNVSDGRSPPNSEAI
jgi:hypothetical protein